MAQTDSLEEVFLENVTRDSIDVRVADLTDADVGKLLEWCQKSKMLGSIKEVDLGNNTITPPTPNLKKLLLAVKDTVVDLDLRENKLGKAGVFELQETLLSLSCLRSLSLTGCELWDYGADVAFNVAAQLPQLRELHLVDNFFSAAASTHVASYLKKNLRLHTLNLDYNKLGDDGAAAIAEALASNKYLTRLGLSDNGIGNTGAAAIGRLLAAAGSLQRLDLSVNTITAPGATALSDGLCSNKRLVHLDLGANPLVDAGASAIFQCLRKNTTLLSLDVANIDMANGCAAEVIDCIRDNKSICHVSMLLNEGMDMAHKEAIAKVFVANRERKEQEELEAQRRSAVWRGRMVRLATLLVFLSIAFGVCCWFLPCSEMFPALSLLEEL